MKRLNIGVIGAGRIGTVHTETIVRSVPEAQVVAIVDVNTAAAKELAERNMVKTYSADYRTVTQNPDIDAVIICSPTDQHALHATEAAKAGKHIFCEKPVDARSVATVLARAADAVEQCRGQIPWWASTGGSTTNFRKVQASWSSPGARSASRTSSKSPPATPHRRRPPTWLVSGGMFLDMTIHDFDMARYHGRRAKWWKCSPWALCWWTRASAGRATSTPPWSPCVFASGALGVIDNCRRGGVRLRPASSRCSAPAGW